jgi:uncharacterized protein YyaL (SSP411 family)
MEGGNRLSGEKSPYLVMHAGNPVEWYPWGEEAFKRAKMEGKPVFLSIGYATCHWCHVMARESFENPETARLLNDTFVCIKVDREERPDLDHFYMTVCQVLTGTGGWPLTIFMTSEREPFFAGTYFPDEPRFGKPGFRDLIASIGALWRDRRRDAEITAARIREMISALAEQTCTGQSPVYTDLLHRGFEGLCDAFDPLYGGFSRPPKFPSPHTVRFLLAYGRKFGSPAALMMAEKTLLHMAAGGIYDHLGYGFHRYATDARWNVPHFEKMLYDQALLVQAYTDAFALTGKPFYRRIALECIQYVATVLAVPGGGFASAEGSESEGEEGRFYLWSPEEFETILGKEDLAVGMAFFHMGEETVPQDQPGARPSYILFTDIPPLDGAGMPPNLDLIRRRLFEARKRRPGPLLDDKVLTDWNSLMIRALACASSVLNDSQSLEMAEKTAVFLISHARDENGRLLHRYSRGGSGIRGVGSDYAFLINGLLHLYEATLDSTYRREAEQLEREFTRLFFDPLGGGYYLSAVDADDVPVRQKELYDGAIPSVNAVMHENLLLLWQLTGSEEYRSKADQTMKAIQSLANENPAACTHFLCNLFREAAVPVHVTLQGRRGSPEIKAFLRAFHTAWHPGASIELEDRPDEKKTVAVFCTPSGCMTPVESPERLTNALNDEYG